MRKDGMENVEGGLAGLAAAWFGEEETGGFVKNQRRPRDPDREPRRNPQGKGKGKRGEENKNLTSNLTTERKEDKNKMGVGSRFTQHTGARTTQQNPQTQAQPELESCPICGGLKERERQVADGKTVKLLTCGKCSGAYRSYCDEATKKIVEDPANAPEPMGKFQWVLGQIDLPGFQKEAEEAVEAYREKYGATVTSVLKQRGYLEGEPRWGEEPHLRRPQMRFTQSAFRAGTAAAVKQQLEVGLNEAYKAMRRLVGRLEVATRVEPELRKAIAAKATTTEDTEAEQTGKGKPKPKKKP